MRKCAHICFPILVLLVYTLIFSLACVDHLIILSHGLLGSSQDLSYLANLLRQEGCQVLEAKANDLFKSMDGVEKGSYLLANEVREVVERSSNLKKISFVGNSLGGLYTRCAVRNLFNPANGHILNLMPNKFMTIATPHLGSFNYTVFDDYGYEVPESFKRTLASLLGKSTQDLFHLDSPENMKNSLIFKIATDNDYLSALRAFRRRRLLANLRNDMLVPLGTSGILMDDEVTLFRELYAELPVGHSVTVVAEPRYQKQCSVNVCSHHSDIYEMADALNSVGWEKVLVQFDGPFPIAHDQIAAVTKFGDTIDGAFGYHKGRFLMDESAKWIINDK